MNIHNAIDQLLEDEHYTEQEFYGRQVDLFFIDTGKGFVFNDNSDEYKYTVLAPGLEEAMVLMCYPFQYKSWHLYMLNSTARRTISYYLPDDENLIYRDDDSFAIIDMQYTDDGNKKYQCTAVGNTPQSAKQAYDIVVQRCLSKN